MLLVQTKVLTQYHTIEHQKVFWWVGLSAWISKYSQNTTAVELTANSTLPTVESIGRSLHIVDLSELDKHSTDAILIFQSILIDLRRQVASY